MRIDRFFVTLTIGVFKDRKTIIMAETDSPEAQSSPALEVLLEWRLDPDTRRKRRTRSSWLCSVAAATRNWATLRVGVIFRQESTLANRHSVSILQRKAEPNFVSLRIAM